MEVRKLTQEENNWRLMFIGQMVDQNKTIPNQTKFGVQQLMTVQDLVNSGVDTLEKVGTALEKVVNNGVSKFSAKEEPEISGIKVADWVRFIELSWLKRSWELQQVKLKGRAVQLQEAINEAKTPEEKRREAEAELAKLNTQIEAI